MSHDHSPSLEQELFAARAEAARLEARCEALEIQNFELASLFTASSQLHGTCREAVLMAMEEIIVNLIGSEQFAICELADPALNVIASVGIDAQQVRWTPRVQEAVRQSQAYIGLVEESETNEPLACLPLRAKDEVIGVIVLFGLLSHKVDFEPLDHQLFDLLGSLAGPALYCTRRVQA